MAFVTDSEAPIKFPTMKPMDAKDKPAPKTERKLDLSKVEIEPLFTDYVDFETFSKSDFRAVKVKECFAVPKSKKLLQVQNYINTKDMKRTPEPYGFRGFVLYDLL